MDVCYVIENLVEILLPRFSDGANVLQLSLDVEARASDTDKKVRRYIHLLFHRPSNYTKVLWNVTDDPRVSYQNFKGWHVESDHDSGWRTDGLSSPMRNEYTNMIGELKTKLRPIDCEVSARFHMLSLPKIVKTKSYIYDRKNFKFAIVW